MGKKDFRKKLKIKARNLPENLSSTAWALVFGLADRGAAALNEILAKPKIKTFWNYYDELESVKEDSARTMLWRLQKKGLVAKKEKNYKLTAAGIKLIKKFEEESEKIWDGKWRMIAFDIPEKKRKERGWLRAQLLMLDYKPVQKSVFIGKQPIERDIYEDIIERGLNQCIRLITIGEIDDDEILRQF